MNLRPRHMKAIELMATTDMRFEEIAKRVGVTERGFYRWLKDAEFCEELARWRNAQPAVLRALGIHAARKVLADMLRRMERGEEKLPLKDGATLLARMFSKDFGVPKLRPGSEEDDDSEMTAEDIEQIWAKIQAEAAEEEAAEAQAQAPADSSAGTPPPAEASQPAQAAPEAAVASPQ